MSRTNIETNQTALSSVQGSVSAPASEAAVGGVELTHRVRMLNALYGLPVDRTPIWLMRQAGRSLPEYRKLKEKHTFLELVQTPELAAEVTLQPIRRFDFDAAILFSDILIACEAMGQAYRFREAGGIDMDFAVRSAADIDRLEEGAVAERLDYISRALPLIRRELGDRTALFGFAGSPWTLANFMMEGGSAREFSRAKEMFYNEPALFRRFMEKLTRVVTEVLRLQIDAKVDAVQIFDSLGGYLSPHVYEEASGRWIRQIVAGLGDRVPVIVFAKGAHGCWDLLAQTGAQALSVDWSLDLSEVRARVPAPISLQGNLDPALLATSPAIVAREARALLESMRGHPGHIFNLGHGVPSNAKLECLESLVETVRNFR